MFCREKPCRYFAQGTGTCPFGSSCFYKHGTRNINSFCEVLLLEITCVKFISFFFVSFWWQEQPTCGRVRAMTASRGKEGE